MTTTTTTSVNVFVGDGASVNFDFTWDRVAKTDDSDVTVYLRDESVTPATQTLQVLGSGNDYTINSALNRVIFNTAPALNIRVIILRSHPDEQTSDLLNTAALPAETLEIIADRAVQLIQQNSLELGRCMKIPVTSPHAATPFDPSIPEPEADQFLRMKADLTGFELNTSTEVITGGSHTVLTDIGTNTHAAIDSHIASTTNPHSVTFTQAVTADGGTNITAAEAETLTDGSIADALHDHDLASLTGDHGTIGGLADDDHIQYHTDARGDARYFQQTEFINVSAGAADAGKPVVLDADGNIDATMINDADVTDANAVHTNVAAEIDGLAEKVAPASTDILIIEDSADSNNKKKVQITNLPGGGDADAIHDNVASEISAIAAKATPVSGDFLLIEDSADSNNKKSITIGDLPGGTDADAIHDNVAAEISVLTEKVTPASGDHILIEDSADSNNKKRVQVGNLPGGTDADAIHDNVASEISAVTAKAIPVGGDFVLIEDSAAANAKKSVTLTNLLDNAVVNDQSAIHDNVASEISAITAKATPTTADFLLIEDAADTNNKKRITIGDLPGGAGGNLTVDTNTADDTITAGESDGGTLFTNDGATGEVVLTLPAASAGQHVYFAVTDAQRLRIDAASGDNITIIDSSLAAVDKIVSNTVGSSAYLQCIDSTTWQSGYSEGTWEEAFDVSFYNPGGDSSGTKQNVHEKYDVNTWSSVSTGGTFDYSTVHSCFAITANRQYFKTFGNANTAGNSTSLNQRYDAAGNTWDNRATTSGRNEAASVGIGTSGYIAGSGAASTTTEEYDSSGNSWSTKAAHTLGIAGANGVGASDGTDFFTLGGVNVSIRNEIYQYSVSGNSWAVQTATLPAARRQGSAIGVSTNIVYGGGDNSGASSAIYNYDTVGDSSSTFTSTLSTALQQTGGGNLAGLVYFSGGGATPGGAASTNNDEFDRAGDSVTVRAVKTTATQSHHGEAV